MDDLVQIAKKLDEAFQRIGISAQSFGETLSKLGAFIPSREEILAMYKGLGFKRFFMISYWRLRLNL